MKTTKSKVLSVLLSLTLVMLVYFSVSIYADTDSLSDSIGASSDVDVESNGEEGTLNDSIIEEDVEEEDTGFSAKDLFSWFTDDSDSEDVDIEEHESDTETLVDDADSTASESGTVSSSIASTAEEAYADIEGSLVADILDNTVIVEDTKIDVDEVTTSTVESTEVSNVQIVTTDSDVDTSEVIEELEESGVTVTADTLVRIQSSIDSLDEVIIEDVDSNSEEVVEIDAIDVTKDTLLYADDVVSIYEDIAEDEDSELDLSTIYSLTDLELSKEDEESDSYVDMSNSDDYVVAVIDSGVSEELITVYGDRIAEGYNFLINTEDVTDDNGHGSDMATNILVSTPLNVSVLPLKIIDENGYGTVSLLAQALQYAIDANVDMISLSVLTFADDEAKIIQDLVQEAIDKGIVVVVSAGNESTDASLFTPANVADAYVIGAADSSGVVRDLSNTGSTVDYYVNSNNTSNAASMFAGLYATGVVNGDVESYLDTMLDTNILLFETDYECELTEEEWQELYDAYYDSDKNMYNIDGVWVCATSSYASLSNITDYYTYTYDSSTGGYKLGLTTAFKTAVNLPSGSYGIWSAGDPLPNPGSMYNGSNGVLGVTSYYYLFNYYYKALSLDLSEWDTSNVTNMARMFYYCFQFTSLDLSNFDTSKVTTMYQMFGLCTSLESLDVSNFDTSKVTTMGWMFYNCRSLTSLDVSNFDTSSVTSMYMMLRGCSKLTSLDVSKWDTSNVTDMSYMFYECSSLISLEVSNFDTNLVTTMSSMFYGCNSLILLDVSKWDTSNVTDMSYMFYICSSLTSLNVSNFATSKVTSMLYMFYYCSSLTSLDVSNFDTSSVTSMRGMFAFCTSLKTIDLTSFDMSGVTAKIYMFTGLLGASGLVTTSNLADFEGLNYDTSVITFAENFYADLDNIEDYYTYTYDSSTGGYKLGLTTAFKTAVDSSSGSYGIWSTGEPLPNPGSMYNGSNGVLGVTSYASLFASYTSATSLDLSEWDTSNVTTMYRMFYYCNALTSLNVSNFRTSNVTNMAYMFYECSSLTSLNVSNFATSNVTDMSYMFDSCSSLTSLDVSNFDTSSVTTMYYMFYNCSSLKTIDLTSFDLSGVTTKTDMFTGLSGATGYVATYTISDFEGLNYDISVITFVANFYADLDNIEDYYTYTYDSSTGGYMLGLTGAFEGAINYNSGSYLDWETGDPLPNPGSMYNGSNGDLGVTSYYALFQARDYAISLDLSEWDTCNVVNMSYMFYNCTSLISLNVSNFDTSSVTNMYGMFGNLDLTSLDVSSFDTSNVTSMAEMFAGCSSLTSLDVSNFDTSKVTSMLYMFYYCSSLTSLDLSNFDTSKVTSMYGMFYDCSSLKTIDLTSFDMSGVTTKTYMFTGLSGATGYVTSDNIDDFEGLNYDTSVITFKNKDYADLDNITDYYTYTYDSSTGGYKLGLTTDFNRAVNSSSGSYGIWSTGDPLPNPGSMYNGSNGDLGVTSYYGVFYSYTSATSLDLSEWDTSNVTNMYRMFYYCSKLTSLDVSNFDTSKVTNMYQMFYYCSSLTSLDVSNFNTSKVTNMGSTFSGCNSLTSLNVSNFDTSNVTSMSYMFYKCSKLTSLDLSNFDTSKVTNMCGMFYYCSKLTSLDFSSFDTSSVTNMSQMFYYCSNLTSLDVSNWDTSKVTTMSHMFYYCSKLTSINVSNFDTSSVTSMEGMFYYCTVLTSLNVSKWDTNNVTTMSSMFYNCKALTSLNVSNFDTSKVTTMYSMFYNCSSLILLDVSNFNTSNVTTMYQMFCYCSSLTSLDVSNFNTSKVTTMYCMFYGCSLLTSLNVSNFDTSNVTSMFYMFYKCSSLTSLDLSNFDTSKVTTMYSMFYNCSSLTSLNVSNFNTSNVTSMSQMFASCSSLTSLDVSNFNTSNVTTMSHMFSSCSSLTSLNVSNFNTSNVTDMSYMFDSCSSLTSLDLSNFDTSKVTTMYYMFYNCSSLKTIDLTSFDLSGVTTKTYMFTGLSGALGLVTTSNLADFEGLGYDESVIKFGTSIYTITYNNQTSSGGSTVDYILGGDTYTLLGSDYNKTDYVFNSWNTSSDGTGVSYSVGSTIIPTSNLVLYPVWTEIYYYIIYHSNYGTDSTSTVTYNVDTTYEYPESIWERTGYTFKCWGGASSSTEGVLPGTSFTNIIPGGMTGNIYSIWTPNTLTIDYNANGGSGSMSSTVFTYDKEGTISDSSFTKTGYTFSGWSTTSGGSVSTIYAVNTTSSTCFNLCNTASATKTLYAQWTANTYDVKYYDYGNTGSYTTVTCTYGTTYTYPSCSWTKTGYTFNGWATSTSYTSVYAAGTSFSNLATSGTVTRYTTWTANTLTINYNANGGSGSMSSSTISYGSTDPISSNSFTKTGYTFSKWYASSGTTYSAGTSSTTCFGLCNSGSATLNLYALWTANTYYVKYYDYGNTGSYTTVTCTYGTTYTYPSCSWTKTGYTFNGWATSTSYTSVYAAGTSFSNLTSTSKDTVIRYTTWTANTLTINYNANGGSGSMSSRTISYGSTVTISSNSFTRTGYTFSGWETSSGTTYSVGTSSTTCFGLCNSGSATLNLYALWTPNTLTINYNANGGSGSMSSTVFTYGTSGAISDSSFSKTGYTFSGWSETSSGSVSTTYVANKTSSTCFGLCSNGSVTKTLYTKWTANSYYVSYNSNKPSGASSNIVGSMSSSSHTYDTSSKLTDNAYTLTGYTFTGWNTNADGTGTTYADEASISILNSAVNGTTTLYAQWVANTYTIIYDANVASYASESAFNATTLTGTTASSTHTYDVSKNLTVNGYNITGWVFAGWATTPTGAAEFDDTDNVLNLVSTANGSITLYATWVLQDFDVTFNNDDSKIGVMASDGTVTVWDSTKDTVNGDFTATYSLGRVMPSIDSLVYIDKTSSKVLVGWTTTEGSSTIDYTADKTCYFTEDTDLYPVWKDVTMTLDINAYNFEAGGSYYPTDGYDIVYFDVTYKSLDNVEVTETFEIDLNNYDSSVTYKDAVYTVDLTGYAYLQNGTSYTISNLSTVSDSYDKTSSNNLTFMRFYDTDVKISEFMSYGYGYNTTDNLSGKLDYTEVSTPSVSIASFAWFDLDNYIYNSSGTVSLGTSSYKFSIYYNSSDFKYTYSTLFTDLEGATYTTISNSCSPMLLGTSYKTVATANADYILVNVDDYTLEDTQSYTGTIGGYTRVQPYVVPTYTITYEANAPEYLVDADIDNMPSNTFTTPSVTYYISDSIPTAEGYTFQGWSLTSTGSVVYDTTDKDNKNTYDDNKALVLYAIWEEDTYEITYVVNNTDNTYITGAEDMPAGTTTKGYWHSVELSKAAPTKTGYIFDGWSTTSTGDVEYLPGEIYGVDGEADTKTELTLYAVWTQVGLLIDMTGNYYSKLDTSYDDLFFTVTLYDSSNNAVEVFTSVSLTADTTTSLTSNCPSSILDLTEYITEYGMYCTITNSKGVGTYSNTIVYLQYTGASTVTDYTTKKAGEGTVTEITLSASAYVRSDLNSYILNDTTGSKVYTSNLGGTATADVYLNGTLKSSGVSDYCTSVPYGATYKFIITCEEGYTIHLGGVYYDEYTYEGTYTGATSICPYIEPYYIITYNPNTPSITETDDTVKNMPEDEFSKDVGTEYTIDIRKYYDVDIIISDAIPTLTGYTFDYWYATVGTENKIYFNEGSLDSIDNYDSYSDKSDSDYAYFTDNTSCVLYANWSENIVEYNFYLNLDGLDGYTDITDTEDYIPLYTSAYELYFTALDLTVDPGIPTTAGYVFSHWVDASGNKYTGSIMAKVESIDLYAEWVSVTSTLTIDINVDDLDGNYSATYTGPESIEVNYFDSYDLIEPTRQGYTFSYWEVTKALTFDEDGLDNTYGFIPPVIGDGVSIYDSFYGYYGDVTLTAVWVRDTYNIEIISQKGNYYDVTVVSGDFYTSIELPVQDFDEYTFTGWSKTLGGTVTIDVDELYLVEGNITLYAIYTAPSCDVSFADANGDIIATKSFELYTTVSLDYTNSDVYTDVYNIDNYSLVGWYDANTDIEYTLNDTINIYGECTLYPIFSENAVGVTLYPNGESIIDLLDSVEDDEGNVTYETFYTITPGVSDVDGSKYYVYSVPFNSTFILPEIDWENAVFAGWIETENYVGYYDLINYSEGEDFLEPGDVVDVTSKTMSYTAVYYDSADISYTLDGGEFDSISDVVYTTRFDTYITLPSVTRYGYTTVGWSDSTGKTYDIGETVLIEDDEVFTALYDICEYTITYDTNGGIFTSSSQATTDTYVYLSYMTLPAVTYTGYTLVGWINSDGTLYGVNDSSNILVNSDMTYTAYWEFDGYNLTLDGALGSFQMYYYVTNNGVIETDDDGNAIMSLETYYSGIFHYSEFDTVNLPTPTLTGYTFDCWVDSSGTEYEDIINMTSDLSLKATYTINEYTLTFDTGDGDAFDSVTVKYNTGYTFETPTTDLNAVFSHWEDSNGNTYKADSIKNITDDCSFTAVWLYQYVVSFDSDGGTGVDDIVGFTGDSFTVSATTKTGYDFSGWSAPGNETLYTTGAKATIGYEDETYTAIWAPSALTITYSANGGVVANTTVSVGYSENFTVQTATRTGYSLAGWSSVTGSTAITHKAGSTYTTDTNLNLTAQWTASTYTVKFDAGYGTTTVSSNTGSYGSGLSNIPTATRTNYTLYGWTSSLYNKTFSAGLTDYTIGGTDTLVAVWTVDAAYADKVYEIRYWANDNVTQTYYTQDYVIGKSLTLTDMAYDAPYGWYFTGSWNTMPDGSGDNYFNIQDVTFTDSSTYVINLYAQWNTYDIENVSYHWAVGLTNSTSSSVLISSVPFYITYGTEFSIDANDYILSDIPNGFQVVNKLGTDAIDIDWALYDLTYMTVNGVNNVLTNSAITDIYQERRVMSFEYYYTPIEYDITYNLVINGATNSSGNVYSYNILDKLDFKEPTCTGYVFDGWTINGVNASSFEMDYWSYTTYNEIYSSLSNRTTGNLSLTANWTAQNYYITYNMNHNYTDVVGNSTSDTDKATQLTYVFGTTYTLLNTPVREGYIFTGWNTESDGSGTNYLASATFSNFANEVDENIVLYAQWTKTQYSVTFDSNLPSTYEPVVTYNATTDTNTLSILTGVTSTVEGAMPTDNTLLYDIVYQLPNTTIDTEGYSVAGWYTNTWDRTYGGTGWYNNSDMVYNLASTGGNVNLYAYWDMNPVLITYDKFVYIDDLDVLDAGDISTMYDIDNLDLFSYIIAYDQEYEANFYTNGVVHSTDFIDTVTLVNEEEIFNFLVNAYQNNNQIGVDFDGNISLVYEVTDEFGTTVTSTATLYVFYESGASSETSTYSGYYISATLDSIKSLDETSYWRESNNYEYLVNILSN